MFKLTFLIKAYNLIVIDCAIDFIFQVLDRSKPFTIISNALNTVPIDTWGISIHYTFYWIKRNGNKTIVGVRFVFFCVKENNVKTLKIELTEQASGCWL